MSGNLQILDYTTAAGTELIINYFMPNVDQDSKASYQDWSKLYWRYFTIPLNVINTDTCPLKCNQTESLVWEIYKIKTFPYFDNTQLQCQPYRLFYAFSGNPLKFRKVSDFVDKKWDIESFEVMKKDSKWLLSNYDFCMESAQKENAFYCQTACMAKFNNSNCIKLNNFCANVSVDINVLNDQCVGVLCHDNTIFLSTADFATNETFAYYMPRYLQFHLRVRKICFTSILRDLIEKQKEDNADSIKNDDSNIIDRELDPCPAKKKKCNV